MQQGIAHLFLRMLNSPVLQHSYTCVDIHAHKGGQADITHCFEIAKLTSAALMPKNTISFTISDHLSISCEHMKYHEHRESATHETYKCTTSAHAPSAGSAFTHVECTCAWNVHGRPCEHWYPSPYLFSQAGSLVTPACRLCRMHARVCLACTHLPRSCHDLLSRKARCFLDFFLRLLGYILCDVNTPVCNL